MESIFPAILLAVLLSAGCMVAAGHRGSGVLPVPPPPAVVVLEDEPYRYHNGYHHLSQRDRYPKELR